MKIEVDAAYTLVDQLDCVNLYGDCEERYLCTYLLYACPTWGDSEGGLSRYDIATQTLACTNQYEASGYYLHVGCIRLNWNLW